VFTSQGVLRAGEALSRSIRSLYPQAVYVPTVAVSGAGIAIKIK
jgi:hypothetical protein